VILAYQLAGGTRVVIAGKNSVGVVGGNFGTNPATSFTVLSVTEVTAISPAGTGKVDFTVVTLGGTSTDQTALTSSSHF
jgi:hypothetical protein